MRLHYPKKGVIRVFVDTVSKINTYTILYSNFSGPCYTLYIIAKMTSSTDTEFSSALAYALSCVKRSHLVLRDKQLDTLRMLYEGHDVFLWVPTGYGKSICYQTLPFLFDKKLDRISSPPSERSIVP